jgi:hypothetical protein
MRNLLLIPLFLLAACGGNGASAPAQTTTPEPAAPASVEPAAVEPAVAFKTATLRTPLPEGIAFPFSYHRLNDNVKQVKGVTEFTYSRADGTQVIVKLDERLKKKKAPNATGTIHLTWRSA